nr:hypothetical protein [Natronomonas salsuginis]
MVRRRLGTSLYAGVLFTALGLLPWASGRPFIFPSLGPSAFTLTFDRARTYRVVGSHAIDTVAGFALGVTPAIVGSFFDR